MKCTHSGVERPERLTVATRSADSFFGRSLERALKLDRGERLVPEFRVAFEDLADLLRVLSAVRVLRAVATLLHRDRRAVSRDVQMLESFGLVTMREETNPGRMGAGRLWSLGRRSMNWWRGFEQFITAIGGAQFG